jgi:hypothetical protein
MDRRTFLATGGLALAGLAAACNKNDGGELPAGATMGELVGRLRSTSEEITVVQAVENILVRPRSRISFALLDKAGTTRLTGGSVRVYAALGGQKTAALGPVTAEYHGEGLGDKAVYTVRFDIDRPGNWDVLVVGKPGGATKEVWGGAAYPAVDRLRGPGPGAKAIAVATPIVNDRRGVNPICTDSPQCSMHKISLDVALANGRPTVFTIGTPRFCESRVCGPVNDILEKASTEFVDRVNFVHAEVFKNDTDAPAQANPIDGHTAAAKAWSLESEPVTYWIRPDNTITERIVGPTDLAEIRALTQALLG